MSSLQMRVSILETENQRCKYEIQEKLNEIEMLKGKIMRGSGIDITDAKNRVIQGLQTKVVLLSAEVERLLKELGRPLA